MGALNALDSSPTQIRLFSFILSWWDINLTIMVGIEEGHLMASSVFQVMGHSLLLLTFANAICVADFFAIIFPRIRSVLDDIVAIRVSNRQPENLGIDANQL
jgi:hypothetical protein